MLADAAPACAEKKVAGACPATLINACTPGWKDIRRSNDCDPALTYFELLARHGATSLDAALDLFRLLEAKEKEFWENYRRRVNEALEAEFRVEVTVCQKVKRKFVGTFEPHLQTFADFSRAHLEATGEVLAWGIGSAAMMPASGRTGKQPLVHFPSPPDLRWNEVTVTFVSDDSVRIEARGTKKVYSYGEMGFKDGRRADRPDQRWIIPRELAKHKGELSWGSELEEKVRGAVKAAVKDIRKRLRGLMRITDDPFYGYRQERAYWTKFRLKDESFQPTDRAKEEDD
jgi:hypothetical protein